MKFLLSESLRTSYPHLCTAIILIRDARISGMPEDVTAFLTRICPASPASIPSDSPVPPEWDIYLGPNGFFPLQDSPQNHPWIPAANHEPPASAVPLKQLAWAVSAKYSTPVKGLCLPPECSVLEGRLSKSDDLWTDPDRTDKPSHAIPAGEPVWAYENHIYVRHMIGSSGPQTALSSDTSRAVFLIPGLADKNRRHVIAARNELARRLKAAFSGTVESGWMDDSSPCFISST